MAILTLNSSAITDFVAVPRVPVSPIKGGEARLHCVVGVVATTADATTTSVFRFCRVPSNCAVRSVRLSCAAGTTGGIDIGLHQTAENGGAVVDADLFGSAVAITSARESLEVIDESGEYTYTEQTQPLWQAIGLTTDPHRTYDVSATVTTTWAGGPTSVRIQVWYVK